MTTCYLSLIIPAYNEEKRVLPTLEKICEYLDKQQFSYEIIIIDDGSTDNTLQVIHDYMRLKEHIVVFPNRRNMGKGYSVRRGMLSAEGRYIFFTDADLSTPIEEIDKCLLYLINGYDVVIGSRSKKGADIIIRQPWYREKMGKIFNGMVNLLLFKGIIDTQCGFKGFKKDVAKKVFNRCRIHGFSFDVEALYLAQKHHYKIKEVPIRWENSALSTVSPIKHSLQMFKDLVNIRIKDYQGHYQ
ncbi:MAG: glycosyltransferase family 2 protein [Candidatus Brocadiaceae bacterium]|nr:glycosyltransferase family 2 protein [Candidatus Brocadiaceae bacterium]